MTHKIYTIEGLTEIANLVAQDPGNKALRVHYYRVFEPEIVLMLLEAARAQGLRSLQIIESDQDPNLPN